MKIPHTLLISALTLLMFTACQEEEITPNIQSSDPNPVDTTGTDPDTLVYDTYILFEMFNSTTGSNLKNTVDSIVFNNLTSGFHKTWIADSISWVNVQNYGIAGNYTKCWMPSPTYGDEVQTVVYFNSSEQKNCWVSYNDLPGGSNITIAISTGTSTYSNTTFY